jgi:hypothetical protein
MCPSDVLSPNIRRNLHWSSYRRVNRVIVTRCTVVVPRASYGQSDGGNHREIKNYGFHATNLAEPTDFGSRSCTFPAPAR